MVDNLNNQRTVITPCPTKNSITAGGGTTIENSDGTVSVYLSPTQPYSLTKECCEFLSSAYYFDMINQTCRWATPVDCTKNNVINVVLNPKGNDGTIFSLEEGDNCFLEIDFDYLLQFSCIDLALIGVGVISGETSSSNTSTERLTNQVNSFENSEELDNTDCDYLVEQLAILNSNLVNTPYSIEFNDLFYCLTEDGLNKWSTILGQTNYNNFLNGDLTTYTSVNVQTLINNETILGEFLYECNVDPTSVGILKTQINDLESEILICQNNVTINNTKTIVDDGGGSEVNLPYFNCTNAATALESLSMSFTIDVYDDITNKVIPVLGYTLFNIGEGNLFNYLTKSVNTGILICGDSGCTTPFVLTSNDLTGYCRILSTTLMNSLIAEATSSGITLNYSNVSNLISANSLNSNWIHYNTTITNPFILSLIANKKIKIGLKLFNTCLDVCVLLDNIKLNKICKTVSTNNLLISKNPSFELNRIIDNKKSWVSTENRHSREFDLTLRETDYDINDYRLSINTKEVDLNISPASAIENDVWCYMNDNSCILTGICSEIVVTCGDGCVDLSGLITTPLSSITTIEIFETTITSELIDAKSRKTLSMYPTLRLLYDRYMNSSIYCGNESSKFDYSLMDGFASLIGTYWIDLIEQLIPSTTLWGSTYVYKNTIFDTQKFEYKTHNTFFCEQPTNFPFSGIGSATTVQVLQTTLITDKNGNTILSPTQICSGVYIMKRDCGSEFIGTVKIIGGLISEEVGSEIILL